MNPPERITVKPIRRPKYRGANTFSLFFALNEPLLIAYFRALGPEERGDSFAAFSSCQFDDYRIREGLKL